VVQKRLDSLIIEHQVHRIRKQKKILLPSDARRIDLFTSPERFGGINQLIPIPSQDIDRLLAEYDDHLLFQFGSDKAVEIFEDLYSAAGNGHIPFLPANGWLIFQEMIEIHDARMAGGCSN
jgi:hypothetical protein